MSKIRKILNKGGERSVLDFGAYGDGVHDDTEPLQLALRREPYPYFPAGTYLVDGTLTTSKNNQILIGSGGGADIRLNIQKLYNINQDEEAALTLNGNNQTVNNLVFAGPDFLDTQNVEGSGNDWYNLSALRIKGRQAKVNRVYVAACEGVGIDITGDGCLLKDVHVESVGLVGIRATAGTHQLNRVIVENVETSLFHRIGTYPITPSLGAQFKVSANIFDCIFRNNAKRLEVRGQDYIISRNRIEAGLHVAATNVIVSNNIIKERERNAVRVADDKQSSITSLTDNIIEPMDQGGANNILNPSSYFVRPVKSVRGNRNAEIERVYQQKAHSVIRPKNGTTSDGRVPLKSVQSGQLITVNTDDTFTFPRFVIVKIQLPPTSSNEYFRKGQARLFNEDDGSTVDFHGALTVDENRPVMSQITFQEYLRPNVRYRLYIFANRSKSPADVEHDENFPITITDIE